MDLLDQIKTLSSTNSELCERIKALLVSTQTHYKLWFTGATSWQFELTPLPPTSSPKTSLLSNEILLLEEPTDFFNDRLDYSCSTFDDLLRLNKEMLRVALKYRLFGNTPSSLEELQKYLHNFELIRLRLVEIEKELTAKLSDITTIQQALLDFNQLLRKWRQQGLVNCELRRDSKGQGKQSKQSSKEEVSLL
jgi:hypothetical protein